MSQGPAQPPPRGGPTTNPMSPTLRSPGGANFMEVLYTFTSKTPQHLTISPFERVILQEKHQNGWCVVRNGRGEIGLVPTNYIRPVNTQQAAPTFKTTKKFNPSVYNSVEGAPPPVPTTGGAPPSLSLSGTVPSGNPSNTDAVAAQKRLLMDLGLEDEESNEAVDFFPMSPLTNIPGSPGMNKASFDSYPTNLFFDKDASSFTRVNSLPDATLRPSLSMTKNRFADPMSRTASFIVSPKEIVSPPRELEPIKDDKELLAIAEKEEIEFLTTLADLTTQINLAVGQLGTVKRGIVVLGEEHRRVDGYVGMCEQALRGEPVVIPPYEVTSPAITEYMSRVMRELEIELVALQGKRDSLEASKPVVIALPEVEDTEDSESTASTTSSEKTVFTEVVEPEVEEVEEDDVVYVSAEPEVVVEETIHDAEFDASGRPINMLDDSTLERCVGHNPVLRKQIARLQRKVTEGVEMLDALLKHESKLKKKLVKVTNMMFTSTTSSTSVVTEADLGAAVEQLAGLTSAYEERLSAVTALETRIAEVNSAVEPLQKICGKHEKKFAAGKAENIGLQSAMDQAVQQKAEMSSLRVEFESTCTRLEQENHSLRGDVQALSVKMESAGAEVKAQVEAMAEKALGVRARCTQYAEDLVKLKAVIAAAKAAEGKKSPTGPSPAVSPRNKK